VMVLMVLVLVGAERSRAINSHAIFLEKVRPPVKRLRLNRTRYICCENGDLAMNRPRRDQTEALPLDLGTFLCFAVYSANHAFGRVYKPLLDKLGLTYTQYLAMVVLWERDGQTVGALGDRLFLESNTLTPLLKRLESLGFVERRRDPQDERQVRIHVTKAGHKLRENALPIPECILDASGLSAGDAKKLTSELAGLRKALGSYNPL
jgi:DNA-binding MarR family transcriptional regulator